MTCTVSPDVAAHHPRSRVGPYDDGRHESGAGTPQAGVEKPIAGPARVRACQPSVATLASSAVAASIAPASVSTIRSSSGSVTTNGGPNRIVSPSIPFALPVPE